MSTSTDNVPEHQRLEAVLTEEDIRRHHEKFVDLFPSVFPKRSVSEATNEFSKTFIERVIKVFKNKRELELNTFKEDSASFLKTLVVELIRDGTNRYVTLTRLVKILKKAPKTIRELLPYKTVLSLVRMTNFNCTIDVALIEDLVEVVIRVETQYQELLLFAENSREISAYALQEFIAEKYVPKMVEEVERADYYAAYAVGIIFFFLDSRRKEYILIQDLLSSTLLLHLEACMHSENNCFPLPPFDFFSVVAFRSVLREFRSLDTDRNGVLSVQELNVFRNFYFNKLFIKRIFEISQTYEIGGCLDFKGFVDLLCAVKFRWTTASAKYHFEAMDLKNDGVLDADEVKTLTDAVPEFVGDENDIAILTAELKDMMQLQTSITMDQFVKHRMQNVFTGVITNYIDYSTYERRDI